MTDARAFSAQGRAPAGRSSPARGTATGSPARGRPPGRPRDGGDSPRGGTRERIQEVALELFAEHGYDKTSLREIAERLGVTKAALYYHFQSKEDIVLSFTHEYTAELDELIAWGSGQPRTAATRAAILARYADIVTSRVGIIRFMEQNQAALHSLLSGGEHGKRMFRAQFQQLRELMLPPDAPLREQIRASLALVSIGLGCMLFQSQAASPEELRDTVLDIACDLASAQPDSGQPAAGQPAAG
jgi:AcrR family transcriptional regulator